MARTLTLEEIKRFRLFYEGSKNRKYIDLTAEDLGLLINTIEAQQQELEKLKELTGKLKELTARHIFHKMTPSTCSIPIQVFENREEWLEFARVNFAITKLLGESEAGET
jgi:hypothetical protein